MTWWNIKWDFVVDVIFSSLATILISAPWQSLLSFLSWNPTMTYRQECCRGRRDILLVVPNFCTVWWAQNKLLETHGATVCVRLCRWMIDRQKQAIRKQTIPCFVFILILFLDYFIFLFLLGRRLEVESGEAAYKIPQTDTLTKALH